MPSTATSPVKILSDLGIDVMNLSSQEDYKSALVEGLAKLQYTGETSSERFKILKDEVLRVKREKLKAEDPTYTTKEERPEFTVKKSTITGAAFKKGSSVGRAENVAADTTGTSAIQKWQPPGALQQADDISKDSSPLASAGLLSAVQAIAASVDNIVGIMKDQADAQKEAAEDSHVAAEEKEGKQREKGLETKVFSGLKKTGEKIIKPVKNLFQKIFDFFMNVFLGRAFVKIIEWFSDPANKEKISSLFKFLKDWWPAIVAGLIAFASPILGPIGVIAGIVALLMWGVPKVLDAAKFVGNLVGKVWAFLKGGPDGDNKVDTSTRKQDRHGDPSRRQGGDKEGKEGASQLKEGEEQQKQDVNQPQQPAEKMASGGEVPGSGDKDTVPAMLTPGEFVMSKGAVKKWGMGTLEGMNAAAGGTNIPTTVQTRGDTNVPRGPGGNPTRGDTNVPRGPGGNPIRIKDKINSMRPGHSLGQLKIKHGAENVRTSSRKGYRGGGLINKPRLVQAYAGGGGVTVKEDISNIPLLIAPSQGGAADIPPPSAGRVRTMQAESAAADAKSKTTKQPGQAVPEFSASTMVSPYKIKTLGITV